MDEPRFGGFGAAAAAASGGGSGAGAGVPFASLQPSKVGKPAAARTAQKDWEWEDGPMVLGSGGATARTIKVY
jgi:hypothetical protein